MFPLLSFLFSFIGISYATYTDLKERTIPNWICVALAVAGLGLAVWESLSINAWTPVLFSVASMVGTYVVAYIFWKLGAWAGGDVKLFTGLAALNPFNPFAIGTALNLSLSFGTISIFSTSTLPLFMLNLFVFSVFSLIPYSAFLSLSALHTPAHRKEFVRTCIAAIQSALLVSIFVFSLSHVLEAQGFSWILSLLGLLIFSFLPKILQWVIAIAGIAATFYFSWDFTPLVYAFVVLVIINLLLGWYGFARKYALSKKKKISALEDGDIPGELIVLRNHVPTREPMVSFKNIIKAARDRDVSKIMSVISPPTGEILADPGKAAGLYPEDIARLQALVKAGKLSDEILVKASSPFAPAVLIAYVFLNLVGDGPLAWWFP